MTCGNLLCGCVGIWAVLTGMPVLASILIYVAAVLDFGDGFVARLLKVQSPIGKELDSLADLVTFGVLPAFLAFHFINLAVVSDNTTLLYAWPAFFIAVFSAIRLAIFNVDTRQSYGFVGVPTPANALLWSALPFIWQSDFLGNMTVYVLVLAVVVTQCYLLVANLPMLAFKKDPAAAKSSSTFSLVLWMAVPAVAAGTLFNWGWAIVVAYYAYIIVSLLSKK